MLDSYMGEESETNKKERQNSVGTQFLLFLVSVYRIPVSGKIVFNLRIKLGLWPHCVRESKMGRQQLSWSRPRKSGPGSGS